MNITVKRKTEKYASLLKLKLILNGETIRKIAFNEEKEVKQTEGTEIRRLYKSNNLVEKATN